MKHKMADFLLEKARRSDSEIRSETVIFDGMVRFVILDKNNAKFCFGIDSSVDIDQIISAINQKFDIKPEHLDSYYNGLIFKKVWEFKSFYRNVIISLHHKHKGPVLYFTVPLSKTPIEKYMAGDYRFTNVDDVMAFLTDTLDRCRKNFLCLEPKIYPSPLYRTSSSGIVFCGDNICSDWAMTVLRNPEYYS